MTSQLPMMTSQLPMMTSQSQMMTSQQSQQQMITSQLSIINKQSQLNRTQGPSQMNLTHSRQITTSHPQQSMSQTVDQLGVSLQSVMISRQPQSISQMGTPPSQPQALASQSVMPISNPSVVQDMSIEDVINNPQAQLQLMEQNTIVQDKKQVWSGALEWQEYPLYPTGNIARSLACRIMVGQNEADVNASNWPNKLHMKSIPQALLTSLQHHFRDSRTVTFFFNNDDIETFNSLYRVVVTQRLVGCVHFPAVSQCDVRVLILMYGKRKKSFIGLIPNDQKAVMNGIKQIVSTARRYQKELQQVQRMALALSLEDVINNQLQLMERNTAVRDKKQVWSGALEWQETPLDPTGKIARSLACCIMVGQNEADVNACNWPNKLLMQSIPHALLTPLQHYFRDSRAVTFFFNNNDIETFNSLFRVVITQRRLAAFVHFSPVSQCDVCGVFKLMYNKRKKSFIGLIPNDQNAIMNGIKQIVLRTKQSQQEQQQIQLSGMFVQDSSNLGASAGQQISLTTMAGQMPNTSTPQEQALNQELRIAQAREVQLRQQEQKRLQLLAQQRQQPQHQFATTETTTDAINNS